MFIYNAKLNPTFILMQKIISCTLYIQFYRILDAVASPDEHDETALVSLGELVGSAADDSVAGVVDNDIVVHQVLLAVRAANVVAGGDSLDVETIDHDEGGSDLVVQFLKRFNERGSIQGCQYIPHSQ